MPEAPIHEDGYSERGECEVWPSGDAVVPSPTAYTVASQQAQNDKLGRGIPFAPYARHDLGTFRLGKDVDQSKRPRIRMATR